MPCHLRTLTTCTSTWRSGGLSGTQWQKPCQNKELAAAISRGGLVLRLSVESAQGAVAVQRANEMQDQYDQLCPTQRHIELCRLSVSIHLRGQEVRAVARSSLAPVTIL